MSDKAKKYKIRVLQYTQKACSTRPRTLGCGDGDGDGNGALDATEGSIWADSGLADPIHFIVLSLDPLPSLFRIPSCMYCTVDITHDSHDYSSNYY